MPDTDPKTKTESPDAKQWKKFKKITTVMLVKINSGLLLMNAAQIVGDVVHDLLGMNVVVSKQVDIVVLSLQGPVLRPGIRRAVQLQLPHLSSVKKLLFLYKP